MIIKVHEVRNEDMPFLYCTDRRVQREVRMANRRCRANGKPDPVRPCIDPAELTARREVIACPQS
jgi:hypothetical protein